MNSAFSLSITLYRMIFGPGPPPSSPEGPFPVATPPTCRRWHWHCHRDSRHSLDRHPRRSDRKTYYSKPIYFILRPVCLIDYEASLTRLPSNGKFTNLNIIYIIYGESGDAVISKKPSNFDRKEPDFGSVPSGKSTDMVGVVSPFKIPNTQHKKNAWVRHCYF